MTNDTHWVEDLSEENLFALYDVALDVRSDLQLNQQPCVPMVPSVVRFPVLMPADGINMRDRYGNLRWKAMKYLESRGVIRQIELRQGGHRWQSQARLQVDATAFGDVFTALEAEACRREAARHRTDEPHEHERVPPVARASMEFEKVTLLWLVRHVPVRFWVSAVGAILLVFAAGAQIGQLAWVRELIGKPTTPQAPLLEPSVVQQRIDQLTEGYNATVRQVTAQILGHEDAAAKTPYSFERERHIEAANRLRSLLDDEHKKYRAALSELRGFQIRQ
jgi:hypothetical protein